MRSGSAKAPALVVQVYFPNIYDIKYLMKFCGNLHGGLNKLAETLDVKRLGPQHQVGMDSVPWLQLFARILLFRLSIKLFAAGRVRQSADLSSFH